MELASYDFPDMAWSEKEFLLMPVGDIQWVGDDKEVALKMLRRHIQWGVDHGAYFVGMGDYIDTFSPSNREKIASAALYDSAHKGIDLMGRTLVKQIYDEALGNSKGRWLGLLEGHHFTQFADGTTSDQMLAGLLETRFLGTSAYIRLNFLGNKQAGGVTVWAHHGVGGGTKIGSPLNKMEQLVVGFEADIYIMGHTSKKGGAPLDRVEPYYGSSGVPRLIHRTKLLANTGAFLKGYVAGSMQGLVPRGGYVERGMMTPLSLGGVLIKIKPRWKHIDGGKVWLPDIGVEL